MDRIFAGSAIIISADRIIGIIWRITCNVDIDHGRDRRRRAVCGLKLGSAVP